MIKSLASHLVSYPKGSEQEVSKKTAEAWIKNGLAELITKPKRRNTSSAKQKQAIKR